MGGLSRTKPCPKAHKALRARVPYAIATDRDDITLATFRLTAASTQGGSTKDNAFTASSSPT